jgi:hypothetical protein
MVNKQMTTQQNWIKLLNCCATRHLIAILLTLYIELRAQMKIRHLIKRNIFDSYSNQPYRVNNILLLGDSYEDNIKQVIETYRRCHLRLDQCRDRVVNGKNNIIRQFE